VDVLPSCNPGLTPPTLYIAGADHLPVNELPPRQTSGPRPPLPSMPMLNFFTLGKIRMQSAFEVTSGGMLWLLSMSCNTLPGLGRVCSSFSLSPARPGTVNPITTREEVEKEPPSCSDMTSHPSPSMGSFD